MHAAPRNGKNALMKFARGAAKVWGWAVAIGLICVAALGGATASGPQSVPTRPQRSSARRAAARRVTRATRSIWPRAPAPIRSPAPDCSWMARPMAPPRERSRLCWALIRPACRTPSPGPTCRPRSITGPCTARSPPAQVWPTRSTTSKRSPPSPRSSESAPTRGAAGPGPCSCRPRSSCARTARPIPARSRSSTPTSCTPRPAPVRHRGHWGPQFRPSSAASTSSPTRSAVVRSSCCSSPIRSAPAAA